MSFSSGRAAQFTIDNSAGTPTDISTYCNTGDLDQILGVGETTTYQATGQSKTFVPTLRDGKASIGGPWDPTLDSTLNATQAALAAGTLVTASCVYGPVNTTSGSPKYTFEAILTDYKTTSPVGGVIMWTASLQVTGAITRTTY